MRSSVEGLEVSMQTRVLALTAVLVACLVLPQCGGGSPPPPPPPPVVVTISASQATVPVGGTIFFFATVTGSTNHTVTWQVNGKTGGDATTGMITPSGLYTAPSMIPTPANVTVKAISQADTTKSASTGVTITLAISPPSATVLIQGGTAQFTAAGTSDVINWTVTCVSPCDPTTIGTVTSSGLYTAPNSIPDNVKTDPLENDPNLGIQASPIFVTAAAQSDPSNTVSASVYVNAGGSSVNQASQGVPIALGTSGGNANDMTGNFCCSGTLGSLVVRNNANFILSNNHVLARRDQAKVGEQITQPGLVDTNCSPGQQVATFSQAIKLQGPKLPDGNFSSPADGAIAQVTTNKVDLAGTILQLGSVSGGLAQPAPPANTVIAPVLSMAVAKNGRTTGLSCSSISALGLTVQVVYETGCNGGTSFTVEYKNQIDIDSTTFSAPGDSGSLIVDALTAQPVGLLYAGSTNDTVANPINDVLSNLPDSAKPPNLPKIVGGAQPHEVAACTGKIGPLAAREGIAAPKMLADTEVQRALAAKEAHVDELMSIPAVIGVGVGASDTPGEAAIVVFVDKKKTPGAIPFEMDGVRTRVRSVERFRAYTGTSSACPARGQSSSPPN
jgi:hypothetical protein